MGPDNMPRPFAPEHSNGPSRVEILKEILNEYPTPNFHLERAALTAAIKALEAEQKFPQFSADNWFENWFNRYPADVRKKLSMHDLKRMYDAILEIEFDPSATMDSLLDSSAADQQEKTP